MSKKPVVIVGGGLAGLCCLRELSRNGIDAVLLEAQDDVGGRVRTDVVDGFRLDRGFQVLQTAYPEAQRQLNYDALHLSSFDPGALIRTGAQQVLMSDPWRRPQDLIATMFNGVGAFSDRLKLARLRWHVTRCTLDQLWAEPDTTTDDYLRNECRFSEDLINRFFRPWFTGVFLENKLSTSSRFFKFIFRMFALGDAALPEAGMGALSRQLVEVVPPELIRLSARVESLDGLHVRLESGETIEGQAVVVAVEGPEASRLTQGLIRSPAFCATTCFYYAAPAPPFNEKLLMLNGDQSGPINNLCVPSNVVGKYAPDGQALVSVSVVGAMDIPEPHLQLQVFSQLRNWFGAQVDQWSLLKVYRIRTALPAQPLHFRAAALATPRVTDALYVCGDFCETASIHGAMVSGRKAAEAVVADLQGHAPDSVDSTRL